MTTIENSSETKECLSISQRENFIENLTHDLKSSVFSQINALKILIDDKKCTYDPIHMDILNNLMTSNIYMRDVILNVLTNFKIQNNNFKLEKAKCNIKETLEFVIKSIGYMLKEKNQTIRTTYRGENFCAYYDDVEIRRVFVNLLSNASKYGNTGSVIEVLIENSNNALKIEIKNKGKIQNNNTEDIFKMYLTDSKKLRLRGSGLGLYITKKIIEAHKGTISARNTQDGNVIFSVIIPSV